MVRHNDSGVALGRLRSVIAHIRPPESPRRAEIAALAVLDPGAEDASAVAEIEYECEDFQMPAEDEDGYLPPSSRQTIRRSPQVNAGIGMGNSVSLSDQLRDLQLLSDGDPTALPEDSESEHDVEIQISTESDHRGCHEESDIGLENVMGTRKRNGGADLSARDDSSSATGRIGEARSVLFRFGRDHVGALGIIFVVLIVFTGVKVMAAKGHIVEPAEDPTPILTPAAESAVPSPTPTMTRIHVSGAVHTLGLSLCRRVQESKTRFWPLADSLMVQTAVSSIWRLSWLMDLRCSSERQTVHGVKCELGRRRVQRMLPWRQVIAGALTLRWKLERQSISTRQICNSCRRCLGWDRRSLSELWIGGIRLVGSPELKSCRKSTA